VLCRDLPPLIFVFGRNPQQFLFFWNEIHSVQRPSHRVFAEIYRGFFHFLIKGSVCAETHPFLLQKCIAVSSFSEAGSVSAETFPKFFIFLKRFCAEHSTERERERAQNMQMISGR